MFAKLIIACILFFTGGRILHLKSDQFDVHRISNSLSLFYEKNPQEKVFLQFDRDIYNVGETIWFKGFLTYSGKPSVISKILYVEFIDSSGIIVARETLPVEAGLAVGSFKILPELSDKPFKIRSYSAWMMNFDPHFYFEKTILIEGANQSKTELPKRNIDTPSMAFFPEGGNLVLGLTSKVAFRISGSDGLPLEGHGKIVDNSGKQIAEFKTIHAGIGSFVLHPIPGKDYAVELNSPSGNKTIFQLPSARKSGVSLYLRNFIAENGDDSVYFRISRSVEDKNSYQHLIICAEMDGISDFTYINFDSATAGNYNNSILTAPTPLSLENFPSGLLHITVFNDKDDILAERLVVLHRTRVQLHPLLSALHLDLERHGKNEFRMEVPGDVDGSYAISVTKADSKIDTGPEEDIKSNFLLKSDLGCPACDWAWYLKDTKPETIEALDLLMLTNKWKRFDWEKILKNEFVPIRYYAEESLMLKGQAFWGKEGHLKPMMAGEFSLMVKAPVDTLVDIASIPVDSSGRFTLTHLSFHDTATFYIQNNKKKNAKDITVIFDKGQLDSVRFAIPQEIVDLGTKQVDEYKKNALDAFVKRRELDLENRQIKQKDTTILQSVTVIGHKKSRQDSLVANYTTGIFSSPSFSVRTLDLLDDPIAKNLPGTNIIQYLQGRIAGPIIEYSPGEQEYIIYWRMINGLFVPMSDVQRKKVNAPAFFLNEQLLSEGSEGYDEAMSLLQNTSVADVAMVRIYEPGTMPMVSGDAPHGAIAFYLKNGSEGMLMRLPQSFNKIKKSGYSIVRQFLSPDYNGRDSSPTEDKRKTLYWNPDLRTDSTSHAAVFSFYNDDAGGNFRILIQGMDSKGNLVYIEKLFSPNSGDSSGRKPANQ
ncbi:MAG: hypothetical protein ACHQEM_00200 [Chitinophagales bacterium]